MTNLSSNLENTMAFTSISKVAIAAGILGSSLLAFTPAHASVLVDPTIRRGGDTEVSDTSEENIVELATTTPGFSTLSAALQAANLTGILAGEGPFTVFAPTDAAFSALPDGALETLLLPENRDLLTKVLYNHVGYGDVTSAQLSSGAFETFDGTVDVDVMPTGVTVDGASVVQADVDATNGVIHAVDTVLLPAGFTDQLQARINSSSMSSSSSSSSSERITRATDLQEGAIDRSATVAPAPAAPTAPAAVAPQQPEPQPAPAAQEPVRGLW